MKIGLVGDVMIGRLVNETNRPIWGTILPHMKSSSFVLANLEAALTRSEKIVPKVFNFKSDPEHVLWLQEANIQVVNLANNHILDYATEGLLETVETLDAAKILHTGAGSNSELAAKPVIITKEGIKIAIFGYTDNEPSWIAQKRHPGTNYIRVGDVERVQNDLRQVQGNVDIIIVSLHWGPNMVEQPSKKHIAFAHALIDSGVDLIHGHSAHIFQGVQWYKNGLIFYDCGDFIDDYYVDPYLRNDRSFFFEVELDKKGVKGFRMIPVLISDMQVNLAVEPDKSETIERMNVLSLNIL